jgi:hypothetical protein
MIKGSGLHARPIAALGDDKITIIKRGGEHLKPHLSRPGVWLRALGKLQVID